MEGNKNKTGQNSDALTQNIHDLVIEDSNQAILQSRANKNGIGAKLDLMPSHDNDIALKMTEETGKLSQDLDNAKVSTSITTAASHELACIQQQNDEDMHMIYDMVNPPHKRKHNIPDLVHLNKKYSADYRNCIQQNGRNFYFCL